VALRVLIISTGTTKARKLTKEHEEDLFLFFVIFEGLRVFVVAFVFTPAAAIECVCDCDAVVAIAERPAALAAGRTRDL
jgi:hypothetical protein